MTSPRSESGKEADHETSRGPAPTSRTWVVANSPIHRTLLGAGLVGALLFPATYVVDGALRPGYNALAEPISALAIGPAAGVQIANFIVYGALTLLSAIGWRAALAPGRAAIGYPVLKAVTGAALIATGIFHQGLSHDLVSYTSLIASIVGLFVLAVRLHGEPFWRGWAAYAIGSALLMMAFLAVFGALIPHGGGGVFEKLATITGSLFVILLTVRVLIHDSRV